MVLEICVDSVDSAITAQKGGADRIELCSDLVEGGITPSAGLIQSVRSEVDIDLYAMIRPRGGDLTFSEREFEIMAVDVLAAKRLGANGVVLGMLTQAGSVDIQRTADLVRIASPMCVTFHRAIDMAIDINQACEDIIGTGAHRILTSGGKQTAPLGADQIAGLVETARGRIAIMAGSGIRAHNVQEVARITGAQEFHASLRRRVASPVTYHNNVLNVGTPKGEPFIRHTVLEEEVRALRKAVDAIPAMTNHRHSVQ